MAICVPLQKAVESGHVEDVLRWTTGTTLYGVRAKDGRRKHGPLLIFNLCPYCGTKQTDEGLNCAWAGVEVREREKGEE